MGHAPVDTIAQPVGLAIPCRHVVSSAQSSGTSWEKALAQSPYRNMPRTNGRAARRPCVDEVKRVNLRAPVYSDDVTHEGRVRWKTTTAKTQANTADDVAELQRLAV